MGIGRTRYYYGKPRSEIHVSLNPLNVYEFTENLFQESIVNKKSK